MLILVLALLSLYLGTPVVAAPARVLDQAQTLFAANRTTIPSLNVSRTNPPRVFTTQIERYEPDVFDTMVFTFDDVPMDPDDVTMAMAAAFYAACGQLSSKSGQENEDVSGQFKLNEPGYNFEVGSDLWSEQNLQYSALKTIISTIFYLGRRLNMRQFTFVYYLAGQHLAVGHLRNAVLPIPPREHALSGQTHWLDHGTVRYDDYGRRVDFELVALAVVHIFEFGWGLMTRVHKSSDKIRNYNSLYTYEMGSPIGVRFQIQGPPDDLLLQDILDIAYSIALFGRLFYMEELDCVLSLGVWPTYRQIYGSVRRIPILEANRSVALTNDKAFQ